jgi:hypothetical protein
MFQYYRNSAHNMQITTVTLYQFEGIQKKCWAFAQMGLAPRRVSQVPGLRFIKFLGSGGANGFGLRPNFSRYGILAAWDDEAAAIRFFEEHPVPNAYNAQSSSQQTVFLKNTMAHGLWDSKMPFEPVAAFDPALPALVLTRATIKSRHLLYFWKHVPQVSADLSQQAGLRFAIGVGELPFVQQATLSIWESGNAMMSYAYKRKEHSDVVRKTRDLGWYKEELFARFVPYKILGSGFF